MQEEFVPRVPRNYVMTEYGLLPKCDVSEEARRLYSNYFMVLETKTTDEEIYSKDGTSLEVELRESCDFENRDDLNQRWSLSEIRFSVEENFQFNDFIRELEDHAENMNTGLLQICSYEDLRRYKIGDDFKARVEIREDVRTYNPFRYEEYEELVFSITREANEHILDTSDMCFTEMRKYRGLLEKYGLDWSEAEDAFYSLDYDHLLSNHRFKEVPRDFWEKSRQTWSRQDRKGLEDTADALLGLFSMCKGNEMREKELRHDLDYVRGLLKEKTEQFYKRS
ncbi:MAG: hypothetical protein ACLFTR_03610 [Candidatus Woesearchaeota archaeon]